MNFGTASVQGLRPYQEDRTHVSWLSCLGRGPAVLAILCDGHGGDTVSDFLVKQLPPLIQNYWSQMVGLPMKSQAHVLAQLLAKVESHLDPQQCAFVGSTCILALLTPQHWIVLNVGDSRAIYSSWKSSQDKCIVQPLTWDHKPSDPREQQRIEKAGGRVDPLSGRVGPLNLSRSIGDFHTKPHVISQPSLAVVEMQKTCPQPTFLILATDGFWDVISNNEAVGLTQSLLRTTSDLQMIAKLLCHAALSRGSGDNISVILVQM